MYAISKLYLKNFKCFLELEIDFMQSGLLILDGPNGYGKTSIFDAIELIITGDIKRVKKSESVNGSDTYSTVCLANDVSKDIVLVAEFLNEKKQPLHLGVLLESSKLKGKAANPRNIFSSFSYYELLTYDVCFYKHIDGVPIKDVPCYLRSKFGQNSIENFYLFQYLSQEDRLSFLKQKAPERQNDVDALLAIDDLSMEIDKIAAKRRHVRDLRDALQSEADAMKKEIEEVNEYEKNTNVYSPLLGGENTWDRKDFHFNQSNGKMELQAMFDELDTIEKYVEYIDYHNTYFACKDFYSIPEKLQTDVIKTWIKYGSNDTPIDDLEKSNQEYEFLSGQLRLIAERKYLEIDIDKLDKSLEITDKEKLKKSVDELKEISHRMSNQQTVINNILGIRDRFYVLNKERGESDICPYCGYNWGKAEELEEQFFKTKEMMFELLSNDGTAFQALELDVHEYVKTFVAPKLEERIQVLMNDEGLKIYRSFPSKAYYAQYVKRGKKLREIIYENTDVDKGSSNVSTDDRVDFYQKTIKQISASFPNEYLSDDTEYDFAKINDNYNLNMYDLSKITKETIAQKKNYLRYLYYMSFYSKREKYNELNEKLKALNEVYELINDYYKKYTSAFKEYKRRIISQIEIPFHLYSSRLLQSYHGGQGLVLNGESFRFVVPGKEHDALYTMSSGQLSAVALAFMLALNKLYSKEGLKMILIDDPIQCMDDINMVSFVELLLREFKDCQIILSTHEEDFSDYIQYKYAKNGISTNALSLKRVVRDK